MFESQDPAIPNPAPYPRWLGDIGGTNARFGWQESEGAAIRHVQVLPCAHYPSLLDAAQSYLQQHGLQAPPCAAFGIANPVTGDAVVMTNHHWAFSVNALRQSLGITRFLLINDFTALALALTHLTPEQKQPIGSGKAAPDCAIGLVGAGTGLGVSGLLPLGHQNKWIPIAGEGGHVSLTATTEREFAVIQHLQKRYGHVSAERVLSGAGLVDLYHALGVMMGAGNENITTPAEVLTSTTPQALEAVDMFCGFLGSVAGDLALTLGARGGVYIGGGIVPRMGERFAASSFRSRFEEKGRFQRYLQEIPTWVIHSPISPALLGASQALSLTQW